MSAVSKNDGQSQMQTRRCSHCGVEKTPQWRRGGLPEAKLLCNACGVRFNSDRLLPEYRPACSPTFSSELHSNHHSRVVKMRRKKQPAQTVVQEMESVKLALMNSGRKEKVATGGTQNGEDFRVDNLLDISNDDVFVEAEAVLKVQRKRRDSFSLNDFSTAGEDFESVPTSELCVPMDDLAEIEWLSDLVDDSLRPYSAPMKKPVGLTVNRRHPVAPVKDLPVETRSKRTRTGVSVWSLGSTTSSLSSSGPSSSPWLSGAEFLDDQVVERQKKKKKKEKKNLSSSLEVPKNDGQRQTQTPVVKRQKKKKSSLMSAVWKNGGQTQSQIQTRRCSHCGVQNTPKWRRGGPSGVELLCNACGLQFNRSLLEYRPACSPAFSSELHSNHQSKVIEMRRKKEKAVTGGAQNGDFFSNLLDFSNDDVFTEDEAELRGVSVSLNDENTPHQSNDFSTAGEDFGSLPISELPVPMDDLAEIEWLSHFVDDPLTLYSARTKKPVRLTGKPAWLTGKPGWLTRNRRHLVAPVNEESCFKTPPPVEIRSKRAKTRVSAWSLGSPLSTVPSSSSTTSLSSSSGPANPLCLSGAEFLDDPVVERQKKKKLSSISVVCRNGGQTQSQTSQSQNQAQTRQCSHCGVQKTPQWRRGRLPEAKLLCNACGVRFNSGRLLPEYRPACSPTFSSELHSNHHSKVVRMRRKKETSGDVDEPGLKEPVQTV